MKTILSIEDDKTIRYLLKEVMEREGFMVLEAVTGKRAVEVLKDHKVDLVLLDMHLPDGSGLDFIHDLRAQTDVPILFVSGDDERLMKIKGLNDGADDYICKPFDIEELIARVNSNLKRFDNAYSNQSVNEESLYSKGKVCVGHWALDRKKHQLFDNKGQTADLTSREFQLLDFLVNNAGRAIKRDELCEAIREQNYVPTPRAIDVKITRIRKKIGDDAANPQMIKTVRGVGYMCDQGGIAR